MKKKSLGWKLAAGVVAVTFMATGARAEIKNTYAYGDSRAEACSKAKSSAQRIYGDRIVGFSACDCSTQSSGYKWICNVDIRLRDRR